TNVTHANLRLLVKDRAIIALSHKLMMAILKFKGWMDNRLLILQQNLERHNSLYEGFLNVIRDLNKNEQLGRSMAEDEKEIEKERKQIVDEFYSNRNNEYGKIIPMDTEFTEIVKEY